MAKAKPGSGQRITRDDLERRFAAVQGGLQHQVESHKTTLVTVAGIGAAVLMLFVFLLGKRSGKRNSALVEIRRV